MYKSHQFMAQYRHIYVQVEKAPYDIGKAHKQTLMH